MSVTLAFHEVDDVERWLKSGKREEFFGPHGITARTFRDPNGSNRVGMIVEIPTSPSSSGSCKPRGPGKR